MAGEFGPSDWDDEVLDIWDNVTGGPRGRIYNDDYAAYFFDRGFISGTESEKATARSFFFEYMISRGAFADVSDFDWNAWRDWYDTQAA